MESSEDQDQPDLLRDLQKILVLLTGEKPCRKEAVSTLTRLSGSISGGHTGGGSTSRPDHHNIYEIQIERERKIKAFLLRCRKIQDYIGVRVGEGRGGGGGEEEGLGLSCHAFDEK